MIVLPTSYCTYRCLASVEVLFRRFLRGPLITAVCCGFASHRITHTGSNSVHKTAGDRQFPAVTTESRLHYGVRRAGPGQGPLPIACGRVSQSNGCPRLEENSGKFHSISHEAAAAPGLRSGSPVRLRSGQSISERLLAWAGKPISGRIYRKFPAFSTEKPSSHSFPRKRVCQPQTWCEAGGRASWQADLLHADLLAFCLQFPRKEIPEDGVPDRANVEVFSLPQRIRCRDPASSPV